MRSLILILLIAIPISPALAQKVEEHPGRRERSTPGLILETGARTAACDVLTFTRDGAHLLAAGDDKVVRTWSVAESGTLQADTLPILRWPIFREYRGNIYSFALSPDPDQRRVVVGGNGQLRGGFAIAVIDRLTGKILQTQGNPDQVQQGTIWATAFSPSGNRVAVGTETGAVWVWDLTTKKITLAGRHDTSAVKNGYHRIVRHVSFATDDQVVSICGTGEMCRWSEGMPTVLHRFGAPINSPIVRSPDGEFLAAVLDASAVAKAGVEVIHYNDPSKSRVYSAAGVGEIHHRVAFSAQSEYLAIGIRKIATPQEANFLQERGGRVAILDLREANPTPQQGPEQGLYAESLAFHPKKSEWLAVAGGDNHEVILWDWKAKTKVSEVTQPARCLWGVSISDDGTKLAFQDHRHPQAPHPNQRGTGAWRYFDLKNFSLTDQPLFEPKAPADKSESGWTVVTGTPERQSASIWYAVSPKGMSYEIPWSSLEDEFPRCYAFIPALPGHPERLAIGHYWGVSIFDLTESGPVRTRLLRGHEGYVTSISVTLADGVSSDGKKIPRAQLITASRDMTLAAWSLDDWAYHPSFGAELFNRDGRLIVGRLAAGSPLWEMGLEPGDEILAIDVPEKSPSGQVKSLTIYDRFRKQVGTPADCLTKLSSISRPGLEHIVYWKQPNAEVISSGLTTLIDRPLWRLFPHGEREWVLWRWRDYYYNCSTRGDYLLGWQRSHPLSTGTKPDFYRAEQLRREFLRPDLLRSTVSNWQSDHALVLFNQVEPPAIEVSDPSEQNDHYSATVSIRPAGLLENQQADRVLVWVNDYLLSEWTREELPSKGGSFDRPVRIPRSTLRSGTNQIIAQCYSRSGARSDSASRIVTGPSQKTKPVLHALLVGVGDYSKSTPRQIDLSAADDAQILGRAIESQKGKPPFRDVVVTTVTDSKANRESILKKLDELRSKVQPDDLFIFHLGGHGTSVAELRRQKVNANLAGLGKFLFLCPDFQLNRITDTTVSFEDFQSRLNRLPCHKLLLLDACHSGEVRSTTTSGEENPVRILTEHGVVAFMILTACEPTESAIENSALDAIGGGHGLFTIALRRLFEEPEFWQRADRNQNQILEANEAAESLKLQIAALVREHNQIQRRLGRKEDRQNPVFIIPEYERPVPIAAK